MAAFSTTFTGSINSFGPEPSTKFGTTSGVTAIFGTSLFGDGSISPNSGNFLLPVQMTTPHSDSESPTDGYTFSPQLGALNSPIIATQGSGQIEELQDKSGKYFEVLAGGSTNAESAFVPSYTGLTNPSETYTTLTASAISWVTQ